MEGQQDLRTWMDQVDRAGELAAIDGASIDLEIGGITELSHKHHMSAGRVPPLMIFDRIPGFEKGHRVLSGLLASTTRLGLALGLGAEVTRNDLIGHWRKMMHDLPSIEPKTVQDGPVMEHVYDGEDVNLMKFPVPLWHEDDGGRYIGTADMIIVCDPDEGWVNVGTYRVMLVDEKRVAVYISPGKHGALIRDKYFKQNRPCPIAVSLGQHPLPWVLASKEAPYGTSEFSLVGGMMGAPFEVLSGEHTGLPIPARAEIVLEGELMPDETVIEGPFGEWTGYYASGSRPEHVMRVKRVMHRHDPILTGSPPTKPPSGNSLASAMFRSAMIWDELEKAGVPDVRGVWCHEAGGHRLFTVVSIHQRYPGHARQALAIASQCKSGVYLGRYIVAVDEDIDATDLFDVTWALATRSDPERDIDFLRRTRSGPLDPMIPPGGTNLNSRALIDACIPFEWKDDFPKVSQFSRAKAAELLAKWGSVIDPTLPVR